MYETSTALRYAPEVYVDIRGYEGYYQVSNYGNVRSLDRVINQQNGRKQLVKGRALKSYLTNKGYFKVHLSRDGKRKSRSIHRLVAIAFLPNKLDKPQVNHINGCKTDNNLCNLEWNTQSEQQIHAYQNGLQPKGEKHHYAKLTREEVIKIKQLLNSRVLQKDIASKFNVSQQVISAINTGVRWNHIAA
ncbi:MAG: NUMOD4 domain-containing protein [Cyanobacteria bacterium P01_G01_bin.39]